jgi:hypothetical protein
MEFEGPHRRDLQEKLLQKFIRVHGALILLSEQSLSDSNFPGAAYVFSGKFPQLFAFKEGMWDTPISALGGSPTVAGGFVRQDRKASVRAQKLHYEGDKRLCTN